MFRNIKRKSIYGFDDIDASKLISARASEFKNVPINHFYTQPH